jgi:hypothetical protein
MARINEHDKKFFDDLNKADEDVKVKPVGTNLNAFRQARSIAKSISDPHKAIAKFLVSSATSNLAFAKESGIGAIGLYRLLDDRWGEKWHDWEPETIWAMLSSEEGIEATDAIKNMIMALQLITKTNQPFENWHIFEKVGQAFNLNSVSFGEVQPLELSEAALTIKILNAIRPKQKFEAEVHSYVAACARHAGVIFLPVEFFSPEAQKALLKISPGGHEVYEAMADNSRSDEPAVKIQKLKLKEISDYVTENWEA